MTTADHIDQTIHLAVLDLPLERDGFLRVLLRELAGTLEDVIGLDEAAGFISVVGQTVGLQINQLYRTALGADRLTRDQLAAVLVDLKRRINGDFSVERVDPDRIVLVNRVCPFGDKVIGRESMCMMTSNVFGSIAADNLGYAKVELQETIARGSAGCRIVIYLSPASGTAAAGREYVQG